MFPLKNLARKGLIKKVSGSGGGAWTYQGIPLFPDTYEPERSRAFVVCKGLRNTLIP